MKPFLKDASVTANAVEIAVRSEADEIYPLLLQVPDGAMIRPFDALVRRVVSDGVTGEAEGVIVLSWDSAKQNQSGSGAIMMTQFSMNLLIPPRLDASGNVVCKGNLDIAGRAWHADPLAVLSGTDDEMNVKRNVSETIIAFLRDHRRDPDGPADELCINLPRYVSHGIAHVHATL